MEIDESYLDKPLPDLGPVSNVQGHQSRFLVITDLARRDKLTVRELLVRLGGGRGHRTFTGTPEQIADTLEQWFNAGAADGFNVMPPFFPGQFDAFVAGVVPILQERGLFRADYEGKTLREHLGLRRPANRLSATRGGPALGDVA